VPTSLIVKHLEEDLMAERFSMASRVVAATAIIAALVLTGSTEAQENETLWLKMPAVSAEHLAFVYAGDIWVADRNGANPRRLTTHPAAEIMPEFSPDGRWIAYSADYTGNLDVYVIPVEGGMPRRLTWHPANDMVCGWTPDGDAVVFNSSRHAYRARLSHLFQVPVAGGLPQQLPMPDAFDGEFSPDGGRIAYQVFAPAWGGASGWRLHRGGTTPPIWIFDMSTHAVERIPHGRVNDTHPMWVGDSIYFLSDRDGEFVNLFAYTPGSGTVRQLTRQTTWDIRGAGAAEGAVVFEAGGRLHQLDTATGRVSPIPIELQADYPQLTPGWRDASHMIFGADLSPSGVRAVFEARGEIFTVPADKGDIRNLTRSSGSRERSPLWSPKGDRVAYLTDASGEWQLELVDQSGLGERKLFELGDPGEYQLESWSPDGSTILFSDWDLHLYALNLESGATKLIDTNNRRRDIETAFSPDGRWLAYSKVLANSLQKIILYDMTSGNHADLTNGLAEASSPVFSRDGAYLFFAASTNFGPVATGLDMSTQDRPVRYALYAAVLAADGAAPLMPESDEEKGGEKKAEAESGGHGGGDEGDDEGNGKDHATVIDLDGIQDRIVALPVPERNYSDLSVAKDGSLLYMDRRQRGTVEEPPGAEPAAVHTLEKFDFEKRKASTFLGGVAGYTLSADGSKALVAGAGRSWKIVETKGKPEEAKPLNLSDMKVFVDPRAEWHQIFADVWRLTRDLFYDPNLHGLDWRAVREKFEPLVDQVARREDLTAVLVDMIAELEVGHIRTVGGDGFQPETVPIGLLGADFEISDGAYRVARIYTGESWNPFLEAPLAIPGLGIAEGDFILGINGKKLTAADNIYADLERSVGKQTVLEVASNADGDGGREVTVKPIANEFELRRWSWIEANRRRVSEATDDRVGYVYLPDTAGGGFSYFNRMFYAQSDKQALILDDRSNSGGQAANYIVEQLSQPYLSSWKDRAAMIFTTPGSAVFGPKLMLIDEKAGSGGDYMPWAFRYMGIGRLIGTTTWGGLIGTGGIPLIDGGIAMIPFFRYFNADNGWAIENQGVEPDIEVPLEPSEMIAGRDPQLERAIEEILAELEVYQPVKPAAAPPYPTELGR